MSFWAVPPVMQATLNGVAQDPDAAPLDVGGLVSLAYHPMTSLKTPACRIFEVDLPLTRLRMMQCKSC